MVKHYQQFGERQIVTTLSAQLSWSHFVELIKMKDGVKRAFNTAMRAQSRWSVRTLRERIDGMLFERTAIAKQPEQAIRQELAQLEQASRERAAWRAAAGRRSGLVVARPTFGDRSAGNS